MNFDLVLPSVLTHLLLPPGLGITLAVIFGAGVLWLTKRSKLRTFVRCMFVFSLALSYALTTRTMGYHLASLVEGDELESLPLETLLELRGKVSAPGAIVILGGGLKYDSRETPHTTNLNQRASVRVQYGAYLAKHTELPVLVSGGVGGGFDAAEAFVMARTLAESYGVQARWQEAYSQTTAENAYFSAVALKAAGIKKIVLVTQAYHMRRSALAFEAQGLEVIMAPCGFLSGRAADTHLSWLPALGGVEAAFVTSHEIVGLVYYRFKGYITRLTYKR
jgi:uncharacterized SAM-binding protein YcdF (DUF218 family)